MSSMQKLLSPVGAGDIAHALRPGPLRVYFEEPVTYRGRSMPRAIAVKLASVEEGWAAVHVVMQARGYVDIIPKAIAKCCPRHCTCSSATSRACYSSWTTSESDEIRRNRPLTFFIFL